MTSRKAAVLALPRPLSYGVSVDLAEHAIHVSIDPWRSR